MFAAFQLFTYMPLMNVEMPTNSLLFFSLVYTTSNLNILPVGNLYQKLAPQDVQNLANSYSSKVDDSQIPDPPVIVNPNYSEYGYDTASFMQNSQNLPVFLGMYIGLSFLTFVITVQPWRHK